MALVRGDVVGPVPVPTGSDVAMKVYVGAGVDCAAPGAAVLVIDQTISSVPAGTVALVATAGPTSQGPELLAVPLDDSCAEEGTGRLSGVHAANAPTVEVLVDGGAAGSIAYGEQVNADLAADTYSVEVDLSANPIVGPVDLPVDEAKHTVVYVVGNLLFGDVDSGPRAVASSPVVPLVQVIDLETCEVPTTTTTTTTSTTTTTVVPVETQPAAAEPVSGQPAYTG